MEAIKKFFLQMKEGRNKFGLRIFLCVFGVINMGFSISWLDPIKFGTDPCTVMNLGISDKIGLPFGTTLLIYNCILFIAVLLWGRHQIGIGTLANMVLVGYSKDFFNWIWAKFIPETFYDPFKTRAIILIPALIWFIVAAALYMAVDLGTSPYDAVPNIIAKKLPKISFTIVRIAWDVVMTLVGFMLGSTIGVVTVAVALFLGPAIVWVKNLLVKLFGLKKVE